MPTTTQLVENERNDLADFLETLTPPQWAADSLCEGWSVRDVVAHVVSYEAWVPSISPSASPEGASC
jgi:uncharacterized protein (TIGR03083 family)